MGWRRFEPKSIMNPLTATNFPVRDFLAIKAFLLASTVPLVYESEKLAGVQGTGCFFDFWGRSTSSQRDTFPTVGVYAPAHVSSFFLAGQRRDASGIDTIARGGAARSLGPAGIHRPYYKAPEGGPASAKKQEDTMREIASYLQSERVAQYLIDEMMVHASNDIYWLTSGDLKSLGG